MAVVGPSSVAGRSSAVRAVPSRPSVTGSVWAEGSGGAISSPSPSSGVTPSLMACPPKVHPSHPFGADTSSSKAVRMLTGMFAALPPLR